MQTEQQHALRLHFVCHKLLRLMNSTVVAIGVLVLSLAADVANAQTSINADTAGRITLDMVFEDSVEPEVLFAGYQSSGDVAAQQEQKSNSEASGIVSPELGSSLLQSSVSSNLDAGFSQTDFHIDGQFDFNHFPKDFSSGAVIRNGQLTTRLGGYVKADLIRDFDAIDSTDQFDPTTIPVGAPPRNNVRFHTRQTRLSLDNRWLVPGEDPIRVMIEGDFFGAGDTFRLRHAYGESGRLLVGQTWSTFAHRAALPNTLDSVGDVASIGRRQAQVRWTIPLEDDALSFSASLEDTQVSVEEEFLKFGEPRTELPDAIVRLLYVTDSAQLQIAALGRRLGFQPIGQSVRTFTGAGMNVTGLIDVTEADRVYGGLLWGSGIGDYRDLPDLAPVSATRGKALESLAWYVGLKHQWKKRWSSNFTYSAAHVEHTAFQAKDSLALNRYVAANLIWQPSEHGFVGVEYLWGYRENGDGKGDDANRLMMSVGFILP